MIFIYRVRPGSPHGHPAAVPPVLPVLGLGAGGGGAGPLPPLQAQPGAVQEVAPRLHHGGPGPQPGHTFYNLHLHHI